jgi:hypothetical protein
MDDLGRGFPRSCSQRSKLLNSALLTEEKSYCEDTSMFTKYSLNPLRPRKLGCSNTLTLVTLKQSVETSV